MLLVNENVRIGMSLLVRWSSLKLFYLDSWEGARSDALSVLSNPLHSAVTLTETISCSVLLLFVPQIYTEPRCLFLSNICVCCLVCQYSSRIVFSLFPL